MNITEITKWCSFCSARSADGELDLLEIGVSLPVCEECMDNYDDTVLPVIMEFMNSDDLSDLPSDG